MRSSSNMQENVVPSLHELTSIGFLKKMFLCKQAVSYDTNTRKLHQKYTRELEILRDHSFAIIVIAPSFSQKKLVKSVFSLS